MMRAKKTLVEPVRPDPAPRFLHVTLSPAQIGKLPEFAHNTLSDGNPYMAIKKLGLHRQTEIKDWLQALREDFFVREIFDEAKTARTRVEAIWLLDGTLALEQLGIRHMHAPMERLWYYAREYHKSGDPIEALQLAALNYHIDIDIRVSVERLLKNSLVNKLVNIAEDCALSIQDILDRMCQGTGE
jgi:hypothetical protein